MKGIFTMETNTLFFNVLFPTLSSAIAWLATRWYERKTHKAKVDELIYQNESLRKQNDRQEIENVFLVAKEWRESAQQWKEEADDYRNKLIENTKKIEELTTKLAETSKELSVVKGQLTKANKRIKELEEKRCLQKSK